MKSIFPIHKSSLESSDDEEDENVNVTIFYLIVRFVQIWPFTFTYPTSFLVEKKYLNPKPLFSINFLFSKKALKFINYIYEIYEIKFFAVES